MLSFRSLQARLGEPALGLRFCAQDLEDLQSINAAFVDKSIPHLTGTDHTGTDLPSDTRDELVAMGRQWGWNILEAPVIWALHATYILVAVLFGARCAALLRSAPPPSSLPREVPGAERMSSSAAADGVAAVAPTGWAFFRSMLQCYLRTEKPSLGFHYNFQRPDWVAPDWCGHMLSTRHHHTPPPTIHSVPPSHAVRSDHPAGPRRARASGRTGSTTSQASSTFSCSSSSRPSGC